MTFECQSLAKTKERQIFCDNPTCKKPCKKKFSQISIYNFCSRSCAITFNNKGKIRNKSGVAQYCQYCGNRRLYGRNYCSIKCWAKNQEVTKDELVKQIQLLALKLSRPPTRRECTYSTSCYKYFGSWNNALIAAGLTPHRSLNQRMYKRQLCIAKDGHVCNSVSELLIDNWLYKRNINHKKETAYPKGKFTADWSLSKNTFVEYFGLANDSRRYDQEIQKKRRICQEYGINLLAIYSKDLFPENKLGQLFQTATK